MVIDCVVLPLVPGVAVCRCVSDGLETSARSQMRSGVAKTKPTGLGYANVFNLGSYARAAGIAVPAKDDPPIITQQS
jgi:hypothetical protein